ncbi:ArgE/DapE family deacylase [Knoellia sp. p5-6-4]|uniref:ArgE/DapE family deacylase n=1 Tax=unclassified Knoellia TaxID=2618719 RepID=UPI0023DC5350|nr:ArgE/DapE family deacylase [Knoellia sp. p5-6-4]MDF2145926.1 ArgE/DapE family deacylase [Knoellia sp. p5-6-4]
MRLDHTAGPDLGGADLTATERGVLDAIDEQGLLADLAALVAIPSTGGSPAEIEAQDWCADRLAGIGLEVDSWDIDVAAEQAAPGFPGMEVERAQARGCVAVLGAAAQPSGSSGVVPALVLSGHTDVVPPGDLTAWPDRGPYRLRIGDGLAAGRGTCDMKGGLAAVLAAVSAVVSSGVRLRRPLAVHAVSGEEDGGLGAFATLRRGHRAEACVIAEPTSGAVVPANAGSLTFRLEVRGRATHGSTRTRGVSAIDLLAPVQAALRELETARNASAPILFDHLDLPWPLSIGVVHAGDWASTVPDRLVAEGRYGVRIGESLEDARTAFEQAVGRACAADPWLCEHPVEVTWPGGAFASAGLTADDSLVRDVTSCVEAQGGSAPGVVGAPYGSDLRLYIAAGVPTLQYGPGDVRHAHALDEHVAVADLLRCARVYALLALRRCGLAT